MWTLRNSSSRYQWQQAPPYKTPHPQTTPFYVKASYAFDGQRESDLSFEKDDIIIVTAMGVGDDLGWWHGYLAA